MEHVVPLQVSANRWVATSTRHNADLDDESPEMVERKVKVLLNKLTEERYSSISDQIITWANKSEQQMDGQTLIQVIKLVFENGTNDVIFTEMYARLCRKIMEEVSPKVQDHTIENAQGEPFAGGQLFRKYLVDRCNEDFERVRSLGKRLLIRLSRTPTRRQSQARSLCFTWTNITPQPR